MLPLDGGAVTCLSIHASDQIRKMAGEPAESTLGGAVALSTIGTRATSGSRLHKSNNKLSGGTQTKMAYGNNTTIYDVVSFHFRVKSPGRN